MRVLSVTGTFSPTRERRQREGRARRVRTICLARSQAQWPRAYERPSSTATNSIGSPLFGYVSCNGCVCTCAHFTIRWFTEAPGVWLELGQTSESNPAYDSADQDNLARYLGQRRVKLGKGHHNSESRSGSSQHILLLVIL